MPRPAKKVRRNYRLTPPLAKWLARYAKKAAMTETQVVEEAIVMFRQTKERS